MDNEGSSVLSSTVAITVSGIVPALVTGEFMITEGKISWLSRDQINVLDAGVPPEEITILAQEVTGGEFLVGDEPALRFTLGDIDEDRVVFQHDGFEEPPQFTFSAVFGDVWLGSEPPLITYQPVNDPPVIDRAQATLSEGESIALNTAQLNTLDPDSSAIDLLYLITAITHANVFVAGKQATSFSQLDVDNGDVQLVHDGSESPPTLALRVRDEGFLSPQVSVTFLFSRVDDPPLLDDVVLTITEGERIILTPESFAVVDPDSEESAFRYYVVELSEGSILVNGSAALTFTQADLEAGIVVFEHDGQPTPPVIRFSVSDGTSTSAPITAFITFVAVDDSPEISVTSPLIAEGATVLLGPEHISATDEETPGMLKFEVTHVEGGNLLVGGNVGTRFTSAQLASGQVAFQHDGSETLPAFVLVVSDPSGNTTFAPRVTLPFVPVNDPPILTLHSLPIRQGQRARFTSDLLSVTDPDSPPGDLQFTILSVTGGTVITDGESTAPDTNHFSQSQLAAGSISFQHDGTAHAPSLVITVTDGLFTTDPQPIPIVFAPAPRLTEIIALPNGSFQLTLEGSPGDSIAIDASEDLVTWLRQRTLTLERYSNIVTLDNAAAGTFRFFRSTWQNPPESPE